MWLAGSHGMLLQFPLPVTLAGQPFVNLLPLFPLPGFLVVHLSPGYPQLPWVSGKQCMSNRLKCSKCRSWQCQLVLVRISSCCWSRAALSAAFHAVFCSVCAVVFSGKRAGPDQRAHPSCAPSSSSSSLSPLPVLRQPGLVDLLLPFVCYSFPCSWEKNLSRVPGPRLRELGGVTMSLDSNSSRRAGPAAPHLCSTS